MSGFSGLMLPAIRGRSKVRRGGALVLGVSALVSGFVVSTPPPAVATGLPVSYVEGTDAAAPLFDPERVFRVDLTLTQSAIDQLNAADYTVIGRPYVAATLEMETPSGSYGPQAINLKLKGNATFRNMDGKAAFKIKIPKANPLLGLRKLTFNNMLQDASGMHEAMTYRLFRSVGVPAPRVGYVQIFVNGSLYGVYANIETLDLIALKRWFGENNTTHLYEGSYYQGREVLPEYVGLFEVDEGDEDDRSDLAALAALNQAFLDGALSGDDWYAAASGVIDVEEMTRHWAAELFVNHMDGYVWWTHNNYYLHTAADGRFSMLPWGVDATWGSGFLGQFVPPYAVQDFSAVLMRACAASAACYPRYARSVLDVRAAFLAGDFPMMQGRIASAIDSYFRDPGDRNENPAWIDWARSEDLLYMNGRAATDWESDFAAQFRPTTASVTVDRRTSSASVDWAVSAPSVFPVTYEYTLSNDGGGSWSAPVVTGRPANIAIPPGLRPQIRVRGINEIGSGAWSAAVTLPWRPGEPMRATVAAEPTSGVTGSLRIGFSPPASDGGRPITAYEAQCSSDSGLSWSPVVSALDSPISPTGLQAGMAYRCRLRARNEVGAGPWSPPSVPVVVGAPSAPSAISVATGFAPGASGDPVGQVRVTFAAVSANGAALLGSVAECARVGSPEVLAGSAGPTETTVVVGGARLGAAYTCRVAVVNARGIGPFGKPPASPAAVAPANDGRIIAGAPGRPSAVSAISGGAGTVRVAFSAPGSNNGAGITAYTARCVSTNGGSPGQITRSDPRGTYRIASLTSGKEYRCFAAATSSRGQGVWSAASPTFVV